jgi:hypothetical protein
MAYYLLRDYPKITYIDFDVPESLALTSWYLAKCFPDFRFLFYGEEELTPESIARSNVILMPPFEISKVPAKSIDVTFSSHTLTSVSDPAKIVYVHEIARTTRKSFLNIGSGLGSAQLDGIIRTQQVRLNLAERSASEWNKHRDAHTQRLESFYQVLPN